MVRAVIVIAILLVASMLSANAAEIGVIKYKGGAAMIRIVGPIEFGDEKIFNDRLQANPGTKWVWLNSPGGNLFSAYTIAKIVHYRGITTIVPPLQFNGEATQCSSACAYISLVGRVRVMHKTSKIGIHTAYNGQTREVDHESNLYTAHLLGLAGVPIEVPIWANNTKPNEIVWITPEVNATYKIGYAVVDDNSDGMF